MLRVMIRAGMGLCTIYVGAWRRVKQGWIDLCCVHSVHRAEALGGFRLQPAIKLNISTFHLPDHRGE